MQFERVVAGLLFFVLLGTPALVRGQVSDEVRVANLRAFAKLYGYVRFFHPSDEAQTIDWSRLAIYGARRVAGAPTVDDLERELEATFGSVAPQVQIYRSGSPPPSREPFEGEMVAWQHRGVGLGGSGGVYASVRANRVNRVPVGGGFGTVTGRVSAEELQGLPIRLRLRARAAPGSRGQGWLRVDRPKQQRGFFDNMEERPITAAAWGEYSIEGEVAPDAVQLMFGFLMSVGTAVDVDDLRLEVNRGGAWAAVPVTNGGFEAAERPEGWSASSQGFDYEVREDGAPQGRRFLRLSRRFFELKKIFDRLPTAGEAVDEPARSGTVCERAAQPSRRANGSA